MKHSDQRVLVQLEKKSTALLMSKKKMKLNQIMKCTCKAQEDNTTIWETVGCIFNSMALTALEPPGHMDHGCTE
jgi:hypothetical protein